MDRSDQTPAGTPMIRAMFRSVKVAGQNEAAPWLQAKVYYPAVYRGTAMEKNTGALPAAPSPQPYPVAILMPGINVSAESYGWLATALAEAGFVALIYGWVVEEMPGMLSLSPGLDVDALKPEQYGQRPSATALHSLIADLASLNRSGPLAGLLDLERILLGGHSAGGSVALFNARPDWFPGLCAVFSYGSHSKASTMLGYPEDTVLKLPATLPTLIMGGAEDGVIAASSFRYGGDGDAGPDPVGPLLRSFDEGLNSKRGDCYLAIVRGANHFSAAWPADPATGRPFLDRATTRPGQDIRADLSALVLNFARGHVLQDKAAQSALLDLLQTPTRIAVSARR